MRGGKIHQTKTRREKIEKAVTLVMLELPPPAREPTAWTHVPSQPLDAITVFTVPNPNCTSQRRRFFQVRLPLGLPRLADHPVYLGPAIFIRCPFRPSTRATLTERS